MTIKFYQILTFSILISYLILIIVASDIGIIQYKKFKSNIEEENKTNILLEDEIQNLITERQQLESQEYVLDLAFELGYVNTGDNIIYSEQFDKEMMNNYNNPIISERINDNKTFFSGWKNYQFFLLAIPIGIAISLCYLLISKKLEKLND